MRFLFPALVSASLMSSGAHALEASKKGDAHKTDACIDACIATQRSCVIAAATLADKSKCSEANSACSTKCPLPNGSQKKQAAMPIASSTLKGDILSNEANNV